MSTVLLEQLEEVELDKEPRKVINGVNIMREDTIVHHLIKEKYPYTMYVHCTLLRISQISVSKKFRESSKRFRKVKFSFPTC